MKSTAGKSNMILSQSSLLSKTKLHANHIRYWPNLKLTIQTTGPLNFKSILAKYYYHTLKVCHFFAVVSIVNYDIFNISI